MSEAGEKISSADARHATDATGDVAVLRYFARPLSNLIVPLFYHLGITANHVTYGRMLTACAVFAAYIIWPQLTPVVVAWALLDYIADCVDGSLARLRNQASYWGKFIDGLVDIAGIFLLPFVVGVVSGDPMWMALGGACSLMAVGGQLVRARYAFFREWMIKESGPLRDEDQEKLTPLSRLEGMCLAGRINIGFVLLAALFLDGGAYIALSAIIVLPLDALALVAVLFQGSAIMRRHRISRHDRLRGQA
jgi:phosphatidylglycerophosphate synthase